MRKAGRILLIVGSIVGFIAALVFIIYSIIMFSTGAIADSVEAFGETLPQEQKDAFTAVGVVLGVIFIILALVEIAASVVKLVALSKGTKGSLIAAIVLSAIGLEIPGVVGAILTLVDLSKSQQQPEQIEPQQ